MLNQESVPHPALPTPSSASAKPSSYSHLLNIYFLPLFFLSRPSLYLPNVYHDRFHHQERCSINGPWPCLTTALKNLTCHKAWTNKKHTHTHKLTHQLSISPHHNLRFFFSLPLSPINFLLLSPYKSPPLLFVGTCLIAISVTPYYISNDWLWALIRDMLGKADFTPAPPAPPPPPCLSAELLLQLHHCGDTISTMPLRVETPDC